MYKIVFEEFEKQEKLRNYTQVHQSDRKSALDINESVSEDFLIRSLNQTSTILK